MLKFKVIKYGQICLFSITEFTVFYTERSPKMYSSDYVWAKVLNYLEDRLTAVTVSTWFDDAKVVELTEERLVSATSITSPGLTK